MKKIPFDFALFDSLERVKGESLQSLLDIISSESVVGCEGKIEVYAIEFPDKIEIVLHLEFANPLCTFEPDWYSCSFHIVWDNEKLSYCGLSGQIEENLEIALSPPKTDDRVVELFSKLSRKILL